jgi:hypothetical protein
MNNLAIVGGVFGVLLLGMLLLEVVQPVGKQPQVATAPPANAVPVGVENRGPKPEEPRKLQVRTELFEKCHRALVEFKGSTDSLQNEIRLIEFRVKDGDEKSLLELFRKSADKLPFKAIIAGLGMVAEAESNKVFLEKDRALAQMLLDSPLGVDAKARRDRRLVKPTSDDMFAKLKSEIPDIELIQGETTTFMNDTYTHYYISYTQALQTIEQQILALEGAIGVGLSG